MRYFQLVLIISLFLCGALFAAQSDEGPINNRFAQARTALEQLQTEFPRVRAYYEGGMVSRIYGRDFGSGSSAIDAANQFKTKYTSLFAAEAEDLLPQSLLKDARHAQQIMYNQETGEYKFTLVHFTQHRDGIPVFQSELKVLVRNEPGNPVVLAASTLRNLGEFTADRGIADQFDPARMTNTGMVSFGDPETVIWAGIEDMIVAPVLAVTFTGSNDLTDANLEKWRFVCDAETGEVLHKETLIQFVDITGNVQAMATPGAKADICTPEILFPYPWARVDYIGGPTVYADENGDYTIPYSGSGDVTVRSYVDGLYFSIENRAGSEETLSKSVTTPGPADFVHNELNNSDLVRAQTNIYVTGNDCRDWLLTYNPTFPGVETETGVPTIVNRTDFYCPCNAWSDGSDGSINFCQAGSGCPNTAWQSILNHEYGHHIIDFTASGQGEYGEGMGDCIAMLPVDDPNLAYGFFGDCDAGLRTADNTCQYLASGCSTCGSEIHDCGQLLSGCVWSVRNELTVTEPTNYLAIISNIVVNSILLHTGSGITPQIPIDFLTLDDDDANLDNGTPHRNEICAGFGDHGLDCPELIPIWFDYPDGQPEIANPDQTTTFRVVVNSGSVAPIEGSAEMYFSVDGGFWRIGIMDETSPNVYNVTLPAEGCDSEIRWYVTANAVDFGTISDPTDAPSSSFTAIVATAIVTAFADDFETNTGWSVSGNASDGQWNRGVPVGGGDRGDPPTDFDGSGQCYLTDNVDDNSDVDGGTTYLDSPTFDLSGSDGTIHYARWYSNNFGADPFNDVMKVYISNNNGAAWTLVETIGPTNQASGGWYENSFLASDFAATTDQMKLRFEASDLGSGSVVEAGVDDVSVFTYECDGTPQPPQITTESLSDWTEGHPIAVQLQVSGGVGTLVWEDKLDDLVGTGLALSGSGLLSGTPLAAGPISFTALVTDDNSDTDEQPLSFTINSVVEITTPSLPDWTAGLPYSQQLAATGGTGTISWSDKDNDLSGSGLSVSAAGLVSGTPASSGALSFTARAADQVGADSETLYEFTINAAVSITTTSLPACSVGIAYSHQLAATGGTGTLAWVDRDGDLAAIGLSLSPTGLLSGTAGSVGTTGFVSKAQDQVSAFDEMPLSVEVIRSYICGDANRDEAINLADASFIINYVFNDGTTPTPLEAADSNCDGGVNLADASYIVNYIFYDGPLPCCP